MNALLRKSKRAQKKANLLSLNAVCAAQFKSSKDFSLATIAPLWEVAGGIRARAIYNGASEDYRTLISGWSELAADTKSKKNVMPEGTHSPLLRRIPDHAVRALVQAALIERDKLKSVNDLLRRSTHIDVKVEHPSASAPAFRSSARVELTATEREALERVLAPDFLEGEGWHEGPHGEVVTRSGRRVFESGFLKAIRKIIDG
nr:gamma-mobile-trio protein GmtX [Paraburkholderia youngii]